MIKLIEAYILKEAKCGICGHDASYEGFCKTQGCPNQDAKSVKNNDLYRANKDSLGKQKPNSNGIQNKPFDVKKALDSVSFDDEEKDDSYSKTNFKINFNVSQAVAVKKALVWYIQSIDEPSEEYSDLEALIEVIDAETIIGSNKKFHIMMSQRDIDYINAAIDDFAPNINSMLNYGTREKHDDAIEYLHDIEEFADQNLGKFKI